MLITCSQCHSLVPLKYCACNICGSSNFERLSVYVDRLAQESLQSTSAPSLDSQARYEEAVGNNVVPHMVSAIPTNNSKRFGSRSSRREQRKVAVLKKKLENLKMWFTQFGKDGIIVKKPADTATQAYVEAA